MKTADSIEKQEERMAARDNGNDPRSSRELTQSVTQKSKRGDASRIAAWRWQPGKSANPGGRPKHDLAAAIARSIFENNPESLYRAYLKAALKGNGYVFQTLAERGYGKLKERVEYDLSPYRGESDQAICERIAQLERELGIAPATDALPSASEKPN